MHCTDEEATREHTHIDTQSYTHRPGVGRGEHARQAEDENSKAENRSSRGPNSV